MLVLGIESATPVASVALADEQGLLGEVTLNVGLTHSEQLLPMIDKLLGQCRREVRELTAVGISSGPGSFTGLRIGMATAKALVQGVSAIKGEGLIPLVEIPTLEAMAWLLREQSVAVSPTLNARRGQIYAALYSWRRADKACDPADTGSPQRQRGKKERMPAGVGDRRWSIDCLIPPAAATPEAWALRINEHCPKACRMHMMGEGAALYREVWERDITADLCIVPEINGLCRGGYVALATVEKLYSQAAADPVQPMDYYGMKPLYLRGV